MRVRSDDKESYLYLNGIGVPRPIRFDEKASLISAKCSLDFQSAIEIFKNDIDFGVAILFLKQVSSQIHIVSDDPKDLVIRAWNANWYGVLLGALYEREVGFNFQSNVPVEKLTIGSNVHVTNYNLVGLSAKPIRVLSEEEACWLEENIATVTTLLKEDVFQNAVHAMASYKWHAHPRARLAIIWSGIEGIFNIDSELAFRLSLYISRFLGENQDERIRIFDDVKKLYKYRSKAVHGAEVSDEMRNSVRESAALLLRLIMKCVEYKGLPDIRALAP